MELRWAGGLIVGRDSLSNEREIFRLRDLNLAIKTEYVRISFRVQRDAWQAFCGCEFPQTRWKPAIAMFESHNGLLQPIYFLVDTD